ncbi:MAG TPA: hypothetical protein VF194_02390 [Ferrovibrio sp.]|uniref:hypothetical protein n=1 Tax=Ferrovibrio sp. TaxID=1917215 RepID=UPI002ED218C3
MTQTQTQTIAADAEASPHRWRFFRAGGFDQVRIETGADLKALASGGEAGGLDQKLWLALACPIDSLEFDRRTLTLIDADKDGRIRAPELLAALRWALHLIRDADAFFAGHSQLPLSLIDDSHPEGTKIRASAKRILASLGRPNDDSLAPDDAADIKRLFSETKFNGDGIVPAAAAENAETAALMRDIMAIAGSRSDRGGEAGLGQAESDAFFAAVDAYLAWYDEAGQQADIRPLGADSEAAVAALQSVQAKIDDYFFRCRLAAFDPQAAPALNADAEAFAALADTELSEAAGSGAVAHLPLAHVEAAKPLPLTGGLNPAWAAAVERLLNGVVQPLLGPRDSLSEADWQAVKAKLAPTAAWLQRKAGAMVEGIGVERLRQIQAGGMRDEINRLIAADAALAAEFEAVEQVEMLARYLRDLVPLINNFIAFRDFYTRRAKATFQVGTLYIDGRSCDLCIRVEDPAKHATLANLSRIYLLYCECLRRGSQEKMLIAAGVTAGDADQLMVGRNGVFYDRSGRDWDAVVVKVVSHPISIREAFWLPFKRVAKFISDQIEKFAAARSKAAETQMTTKLLETGTRAVTGTPAAAPAAQQPPQAFDAGRFAGIFAAIGLAIGAIGTALASVVTGLLNLAWWQIPLAVAGVILLISGPSMLIAAMQLRQRNLAPILDANGWAVNARARINIPFGGSLTQLAKLPPGAERALTDPYAERTTPWRLLVLLVLIVILLALAWHYNWMAALFGH